MTEPKPPPIAVVVWHDAHFSFRDSDDSRPHTVTHSTGWLTRCDDKCVKLSQSRYNEGEGKPEDTLTIPRAMVQSVRIVRSLNRPN